MATYDDPVDETTFTQADESSSASLEMAVANESFLARLVTILHVLRKADTNETVYAMVANHCTSGHRTFRTNAWVFDGGLVFLESVFPEMYSLYMLGGNAPNTYVKGPYNKIMGLITRFIINLEKAVCHDIATLASNKSSSRYKNIGSGINIDNRNRPFFDK